MGRKKIPALPPCDPLDGTEQLEAVQDGESVSLTGEDLATYLESVFVPLDGTGAMTGPVTITYNTNSFTTIINPDGSIDLEVDDDDTPVTLNPNGTLETGTLYYQSPVTSITGTPASLQGGNTAWNGTAAGVQSAVVLYNSASAGTLTIRANTGSATLDFKTGDFFSVVWYGTGQPTVVAPAGGTVLCPADHVLKPYVRYSVITLTCLDADANRWLASGDLEPV